MITITIKTIADGANLRTGRNHVSYNSRRFEKLSSSPNEVKWVNDNGNVRAQLKFSNSRCLNSGEIDGSFLPVNSVEKIDDATFKIDVVGTPSYFGIVDVNFNNKSSCKEYKEGQTIEIKVHSDDSLSLGKFEPSTVCSSETSCQVSSVDCNKEGIKIRESELKLKELERRLKFCDNDKSYYEKELNKYLDEKNLSIEEREQIQKNLEECRIARIKDKEQFTKDKKILEEKVNSSTTTDVSKPLIQAQTSTEDKLRTECRQEKRALIDKIFGDSSKELSADWTSEQMNSYIEKSIASLKTNPIGPIMKTEGKVKLMVNRDEARKAGLTFMDSMIGSPTDAGSVFNLSILNNLIKSSLGVGSKCLADSIEYTRLDDKMTYTAVFNEPVVACDSEGIKKIKELNIFRAS